ncbi:sulfurtransferase-like selenium metabolism protein YedF [Alkalithermobacter paradoxus]|uniref:SirA-like protein n=1 Tax=Alkalithermobacter paradoxus TaxID=29349 RepID=A0A1V4I640_9FIRM|nr:SirA-like protein [[Clostridium] thermoalcaliphilum]
MKKIQVDARGLDCPKPVINAKKELENINEGIVVVIVDNEIAKENVLKLSKSMNCEAQYYKDNEEFYIEIKKGNVSIEICENKTDDKIIMISSEFMGKGSDELGKVLMKGFIYTITESKPYPKAILFINSGVKLTTENEDTIENLKKLQNSGVSILSCGTCLDYYNLKDKLQVGNISNMYDIVENINKSSNSIII